MKRNRKARTTQEILNRCFLDPVTNCHNYTGHINKTGYGVTHGPNTLGESRVHRISYKFHKGEIGDKLVCHTCDNPACINPAHLFLGTSQDNNDDMWNKGRQVVLKGSAQPVSKLAEDDIVYIRKLREFGMTRKDISIMFEVSRANIDAIFSGYSWKHVKETQNG